MSSIIMQTLTNMIAFMVSEKNAKVVIYQQILVMSIDTRIIISGREIIGRNKMLRQSSVWLSLVTDWVVEGPNERFSRDPFPVFFFFFAEGHCEQFWHMQCCPFFHIHPAFPLPTTESPTLQAAQKNGFREVMLVCLTYPNHSSFRLFLSCQKTFLSANKEVYLALHPVFGLVLQVGDAEKFP